MAFVAVFGGFAFIDVVCVNGPVHSTFRSQWFLCLAWTGYLSPQTLPLFFWTSWPVSAAFDRAPFCRSHFFFHTDSTGTSKETTLPPVEAWY